MACIRNEIVQKGKTGRAEPAPQSSLRDREERKEKAEQIPFAAFAAFLGALCGEMLLAAPRPLGGGANRLFSFRECRADSTKILVSANVVAG